jgi:hypothetical protein
MKQRYLSYLPVLFAGLFMAIIISSCGKKNDTTPTVQPIATIGLYEYASTSGGVSYKRIFMPVAAIGTLTPSNQTPINGQATIPSYLVFDTGSTGITVDAAGLIPASMITTNGITFTGDSIVVNGITITSTKSTVSFGDATSGIKEYGYLAYASMTFGEVGSSQVKAPRVPFFLTYKVEDQNGTPYSAHSADVFGVGSGVSSVSTKIASPLSYLTSTTGAVSGFKLTTTTASGFISTGTFMPAMLTIGLTPTDLTSAGFIMHPLTSVPTYGYVDEIPATITYNGTVVSSARILFDTGTPAYTVIEDPNATGVGQLATGSVIKVTTNKGFTFQYTVNSNGNLTTIQNPNNTKDFRTIFSLDFFNKNEYLLDYKNHQIGLKND